MLKHATPRSSPSLSLNGSPQRLSSVDSTSVHSKCENEMLSSSSSPSPDLQKATKDGIFNERSVDCDGIISHEPLIKKCASNGLLNLGSFFGDRILNLGSGSGNGIGPVITHGKAIVRRGLSFNGKKDPDAASIRSVKSEGQGIMKSEPGNHDLPVKAISEVALEISMKLSNDFQAKLTVNDTNPSSIGKSDQTGQGQVNRECAFIDKDKRASLVTNQSHFSKKVFGLSKSDHPSLKSLLRLPGVYGHIPVPEGAPTGSPHILNPDSLSLNSADSFLSSNSGRTSSRSWSSNTSSNSNNTSDSCNSNASSSSAELTSTTLKVFAKCLRSDIEYKTVNIGSKVTSRQLINLLLSKARMRHRDSNLFYLTMEVTVRRWSGVPVRALLVLEESARPAQLALCRPSGDLRFVLQMRRGGVIKVHDTVLMPGSQYKSLLVSYRTTAEETVQLLLNCCGRRESKHYFALHEVCQSPQYKDRRLGSSERPLEVKAEWPRDRKAEYVFVLRRNMSQALSLRKLSALSAERKQEENKENYLRKCSPESDTLRGSAVMLNVISRSTQSTQNDGRIRGRSLSPARLQNALEDDAVIDCTQTTPVMTFVKSQATNCESLSNVSSGSHNSSASSKCYGENSNQTWAGAMNDDTRFSGKVLSKFDITYPQTCYRRSDIKTQLKSNQKSVTFNLTNSVPTTRKIFEYSSNSLPKTQKVFHSIQNISDSISNIIPAKLVTGTNRLPNDLKSQQEKFAKALEKLNPHINLTEVDEPWSSQANLNLFKTKNCHKPSSELTVSRTPNFQSSEKQYQNLVLKEPKKEPKESLNSECRDTINNPTKECAVTRISSTNFVNVTNTRLYNTASNYADFKSRNFSSSAAQTELTCIPLKGLQNKTQKWNSIETLMDLTASTYDIKEQNKKASEGTLQGNISLKMTFPEDNIGSHRPGIQCEHNCKKCFYI